MPAPTVWNVVDPTLGFAPTLTSFIYPVFKFTGIADPNGY